MRSKAIASFLCVGILVLHCYGDELPQHGGHDPIREEHNVHGEHNVKYDHEAVVGSRSELEEYENLTRDEAKKRLSALIDRMDSNHDDSVSKQELIDWVYSSFKSLDEEEAEEYFADQDKDGDGSVTLEEYMEDNYGYSMEEMKKWQEDASPEVQHYAKMFEDDKEKFEVADRDGNGELSLEEYHGFYHPWSRDYMHDLEVDRALKEQDLNKDGLIDMTEYIGSEMDDDDEEELVEKENFIAFDENEDGQLDRNEIKKWVLPDHMETAEEEAEHLILETDGDGNGVLSRGEILEQFELWVGSAATDYGLQLSDKYHDPGEL